MLKALSSKLKTNMRLTSPLLRPFLLILLSLMLAACQDRQRGPSPITQQAPITQRAPQTTATASAATPTGEGSLLPAAPSPAPTMTPQFSDAAPVIDDDQVDPRGQRLADYVGNLESAGEFSGTVFVAHNGRILLNQGFGQANVTAGIANSPQTQFRIGSLTKQFTAAAILKLQEQGLLDVREPLSNYLPDYPRAQEITIHQLLTHTAGIPNYERRPDLPQVVQSPIALDALIASFANEPLQFPPGRQYEYSSSGYVILTKIIELVSGEPYEDFLQEQFFEPLGMNSTGYDFLAPDLPNPAVGYQLTPGGPQPAIRTDSSWPTGAGALYSTVEDLYRWDRALYGDELLSPASREAFFTPYVDTRQGAYYGYGWDIGTTSGRPSIVHGGGIFGFASFMARFPEDDAVVIVLSNGIQMPPRIVAEGLADILFGSS